MNRDIPRAIGAGTGLVALAVIPPLALARLGWPLPHGLPSPAEVSDALASGALPDGVVVRALACVCWVAWTLVIGGAAAEAWAWVRGHAPQALAGPLQPLVARAVAAIAVLVPLAPRSAAAHPAPKYGIIETFVDGRGGSSNDTPPILVGPPLGEADGHPTHTVERYQSLWEIAEIRLGSGERWVDLWDLNRGRDFGGRTFDDPSLLFTGWQLYLPDPPVLAAPPVASPVDADLADQARALARDSARPAAQPANEPAGHELAGAAAVAAPARYSAQARENHEPVAALAQVGLASAGVLALVAGARRLAQRRRRRGTRLRPLSPAAKATERVLRASAESETATRIDVALRLLSTLPERPEVIGAVAHPGGDVALRVAGGRRRAVPVPFVAARGGWWRLPAGAEVDDVSAQASVAPALVPVGITDDGRWVALNLEAANVVGLDGDADACAGLLRALALELATASWADGTRVACVGFGDVLAATVGPRLSAYPSLDALAIDMATRAAGDRAALDRAAVEHPGALRTAADPWTPTVVLCAGAEPMGTDLAGLLPGTTVVMVGLGEVAGAVWRLVVEPDRLMVDPLGIECRPSLLSDDDLAAVADLLAESARVDAVLPERFGVVAEVPRAAPGGVEVRVLGPVEITGASDFARGRARELVAYLALHPAGVDVDRAMEAMWPLTKPNLHTMHSTVSAARAAVGSGPNGPRLPEARGPGALLRLDDVSTDAGRFRSLVAVGGRDQLRVALELVRGRPFEATPPRSYAWAWDDNHVHALTEEIVDAAEALGEACLDASDLPGARWAARAGLRVLAGDERLYRILMRAADAGGDAGAVEGLMGELVAALELDGVDPDALHPETVALYESLRRTRAAR